MLRFGQHPIAAGVHVASTVRVCQKLTSGLLAEGLSAFVNPRDKQIVETEVSQDIGEARSHARQPGRRSLLPEYPPLCLMWAGRWLV